MSDSEQSDKPKRKTYTCENCHGVFEEGWTDAESEQERIKVFGGPVDPTDVRVCDDCYRQIMRAANS